MYRGLNKYMRVIIAEKPSVAKNIADALHIKTKEDGCYKGKDYYITWAFGHLLELYDAKDYDEKMKTWRLEYFPFIPEKFKYKIKQNRDKKTPDQGAQKQLACIKNLINREEVDAVISACDYDREGQIIADIIFAYLKVKKPVYRLLLNEWTEKEVLKGLENIVPNTELKPLQDAGISRQHADWLIGINLTSVATLKYGAKGEVLNIGRVLLPTLKMIYDRDKEIENFKQEPYYKLIATFAKDNLSYQGTYTHDKKERFENKEQLSLIKKQIEGKQGQIINKEVTEKIEYPQSLFNLSALQGYITSKYQGFTSDKVLNIAQSLYEKKYITYPRTASTVLDESLIEKAKSVLNAHKKGLPYENEIQFKVTKKIFNSQKVESHSAIIPTYLIPKNLTSQEQLVYTAVRNRFLAQFMPPARIKETIITTQVEGIEGLFITKGKVQKELGYKKVENEEAKEVILPDISEGTYVDVDKLEVTEHTTKPPAPYTEKTLLRAMETCGKQFKNSEEDASSKESEDPELMDAILSGFSIGTPATRAETIKKLITAGYVRMEKKNIRCLPKGRYLIENLPVKELMDLEYTGRLEKTLSDIQKSLVSKEDFMNHIKEFVKNSVMAIKGQRVIQTVQNISSQVPKVTSTSSKEKAQNQEGKRQVLGKCPICGNNIVEGTKGYGCMGYKTGCNYVIWKDSTELKRYKKRLTKKMVKELLEKGEVQLAGLTDEKGNSFDGIVKNIQNRSANKYELIIMRKE